MTPTKQLALKGLREILERGSAQRQPHCGLCTNFRVLMMDKFRVGGRYQTPELKALVNNTCTLVFSAIRSYADEHGLDRYYPIEGGGSGYDRTDSKWVGVWLNRRQTMIKWLINYIETEVPDETGETDASTGAK